MFLHVDMSRTNASVRQVYMDVLLSALIAVILAFLAVSYTANRMTRPITEMNNAVKRFSHGEFDARAAVPARTRSASSARASTRWPMR